MNSIDLFAWLENFSGKSVVDFILFLAGSLTREDKPGWVSLGLVVALVGLSLWYDIVTRRFVGAVRSTRAILRIEAVGSACGRIMFSRSRPSTGGAWPEHLGNHAMD